MIRLKYLVIAIFIQSTLVSSVLINAFTSINVYSLSNADFNPGRIIDDGMFFNSGTMSVDQIQSFLNSQMPNCDTNHAGYTGTSGTIYNAPWVCLKDFYENSSASYNLSFTYRDTGGVTKTGSRTYYQNNAYRYTSLTAVYPSGGGTYSTSGDYTQGYILKATINSLGGTRPSGSISAAQIIYNASQQYGINPQVILVTLQKEQGLITDTWPAPWQYQSAMGYGCPDFQPCSSNYAGFSNQVNSAAWQFRQYTTNPDNFNFAGLATRYIQFNPNSSCGGTNVYLQNQATANLYNYTPYQPNSAILNGSGDSCSAYGNLNFWKYFVNWFGSTQFPQPTGGLLYRQTSNGKIYLYSNETLFYVSSPSVMENYDFDKYKTIPASDNLISSLTYGGILNNVITDGSNIYMVNGGYKNSISTASMCTDWGVVCNNINTLPNLGLTFTGAYLKPGSSLGNTAYYNGVYYKVQSGNKMPYADKDSFLQAGYSTSSAVLVDGSNFNLSLGKLQITTPGIIKFSPKSTIYYFTGSGFYEVPDMDIYDSLGLGTINHINEPLSSYNSTDNVISSGTLGYWYTTSDGSKYIVNNSMRIKLTTTQQQLWPNSTYITGLDSLVNNLPSATIGSFIKSGIDFYQLRPDIGEKRYISSLVDYVEMGGNGNNTTRLNPTIVGFIKLGPPIHPDGRLVKVDSESTIYVINNGDLLKIPSMDILNAYSFNTSKMRIYAASVINQYNKPGSLQLGRLPNGSIVVAYNKQLISLTQQQKVDFGFTNTNITDISLSLIKDANVLNSTSTFRNGDDGRIYYGSSGSLHYIDSMTKLQQITSTPPTQINTPILDMFTIGNAI